MSNVQKIQIQSLQAGQTYRTRKGETFTVEAISVLKEGDYHRQPRRQFELTVRDHQQNRTYETRAMDTDQVILVQTIQPTGAGAA